MTEPEHYRAAEQFANEAYTAARNLDLHAPDPHRLLAEAQVHATHAVAAATALGQRVSKAALGMAGLSALL